MKKYTQKEINNLIVIKDYKKYIKNVDFSYCNSKLNHADLSQANLSKTDLNHADLNYADLHKANLTSANLSEANLSNAYLGNANLSDADLTSDNLSAADLHNAIGNKKSIKSMQLEKWNIIFTNSILAIGCEQHTHEQWKNFTDDEISSMDDNALTWWKKWKDFIFTAINLSFGDNNE